MRSYKKLLIGTMVACCCLGTTVFATEVNNLMQTVDMRSQTLQTKEPVLMGRQPGKSYHMSNIPVQDQKNAGICWALTAKNIFETVLNGSVRISAKQIAYSASNSFTSGSYEYGLNRDALQDGGNMFMALGQMTNGRGIIPESSMPFSSSELSSKTTSKINVSEVASKNSIKKINEWLYLSGIEKVNNGSSIVFNSRMISGEGNNISESKVKYLRDKIKKHIINYGAVSALIVYGDAPGKNYKIFYNSDNNSYYCPDKTLQPQHAVTIIGWDDEYGADKFKNPNIPETFQPKHNGAYIVQNSHGSENTYFYVSYDDAYIEAHCIGITDIVNKDYYNLYQYDYQGANKCNAMASSFYQANTYTRNITDAEKLKEVAITTFANVKCTIYVIPDESRPSSTNPYLKTPVATAKLTPGYHTIKINKPVILDNTKFTVVVKYDKVTGEKFGETQLRADNTDLPGISNNRNI